MKLALAALAGFVIALILAGCGGSASDSSPTVQQEDELPTVQQEDQLSNGECENPEPPDTDFVDNYPRGQLPNVGWAGRDQPVIVAPQQLPDGYRLERFACVNETVASIDFAPDGRLFLTEQHTGRIMIINPDGSFQPEPFAVVGPVADSLETGLLGITFHPDFPDPPYVYAYYIDKGEPGNAGDGQLVRFSDDQGLGKDQELIAVLPGPKPDTSVHVGGSLNFGPDGLLYVTIGDTSQAGLVQDLSELVGKVLRMNADGSVPDVGPFVDRESADGRVFAYGFRNTWDIAYHPELDAWIGGENQNEAYDEINVIRAGGNYGHPTSVGFIVRQDLADAVDPIWVYLFKTGPAGIDVYLDGRLTEFEGQVFMCQFHRGGLLHRIDIDEGGVKSDVVIARGCTSDVRQGPDGFLYFVDGINGEIWRIVDTPAQSAAAVGEPEGPA